MAAEVKNPQASSAGTSLELLDGNGNKQERKIVVIEQTEYTMLTDLWCDVFVVGEEPYGFPSLLARARCQKAESIHKADIVLFTGGMPDVSPELYGEERHEKTFSDVESDVRDIQVFQEAAYLGIPMVGVCRGAQFLHVMNHGKLYQHVDHHNGRPHDIFLPLSEEYIGPVSSVHHQMCRPNEANGMVVLALAHESEVKWLNPTLSYSGLNRVGDDDIEAFWYPETACLGVQGHPEYSGFEEYTLWFTELIDQFIIDNPDIHHEKGHRRLKQEILERRKWRMPETVWPFLKEHG